MSENAAPAVPAGNASSPPGAKPEQKAGSLDIKIKDQQENETYFKIKTNTKFGKVFDAYCDRQSLARNTVRFLFEGTRVQDNDTPESLELEDGDMIQAMLEQVGGDGTDSGNAGKAVNTGASGAASAPAAEDEKPEKAGTINIKVKDQNEGETFFKIKNHTKLGKVFDAYCDRQSLARRTVRFLFEGSRIQDTDTPESLEMQDEDMVQAVLEQIGGGGGADESTEKGPVKPEAQRIFIKVKDASGHEVEFKCRNTTLLKKVMDAFCQAKGRKPNTLRFFTPEGKRVNDDNTPESLNLEDGDILEVQEEQQGGRI